MMAQQDISTAARVSIQEAAKKQRKHEKHLRTVDRMDPAEWQETPAPTEAVIITLGTVYGRNLTRQQSRRRIVDARLCAALDSDQQDAAQEIEHAYQCLIRGLGMKPASLERKSGGKGDLSDRQGIAAAAYNAWIKEVDVALKLDPRDGIPMRFGVGKAKDRWTLERLCPEAATAIICHGKSREQVDQERGKRNGWATENLKQALTIWLYRTGKRRRPPPFKEDTTEGLTMKQLVVRQRNRRVDRIADIIAERTRVAPNWKGEKPDG